MDFYHPQKNSGRQSSLRHRWKFYVILTGGALILILAIYVVVISEIFKVNVQIFGLQRLTKQQFLISVAGEVFQNRLKGFLGLNNYFTWPSDLKLKEPLIAGISVDKQLFKKKILVIVEERQPFGIWCVNNPERCFWFDKEGVIFEPAPISEGYLILRIDSDSEQPLILGEAAVKPEFYHAIYDVLGFFSDSGLGVESYLLKNQLQEFHIQLKNGPGIRFGYRFNSKGALDALNNFMQKEDWRKSDYIDLTVENRVYIK